MILILGVALATVCLLTLSAVQVESEGAAREGQEGLLGTWQNRSSAGRFRQVKHLTPTHFTWVIYNVKKRAPIGVAGGTWELREGMYRETYEFASFAWRHLRGKEAAYASTLEGDSWSIRGRLDTGFLVDETWDRQRP